MKTIRKVFLIIAGTLSITQMRAQWSVTPELGGNVTKYHEQSAKMGIKAGAAINYTFPGRRFSLQSGLYYVKRNTGLYKSYMLHTKDADGNMSNRPIGGNSSIYYPSYGEAGESVWMGISTWNRQTFINYLQLPIMARFNRRLATDTRFFVAVGPYFGYALNGKINTDIQTQSPNGTINTYSDDSFDPFERKELRRFDWGLGLQTGFEIKNFQFSLQYEVSFFRPRKKDWSYEYYNIVRTEFYQPVYQTFHISVGYKFNLNK